MPRPRKDRTESHVRRRPIVRGPRAGQTAYDVRVPLIPHGTAAKTFYDLDAACAWRDEQLLAYRRGEATRQVADSVGELLTRWLEDEMASRVRASTLGAYRDTVRVHVAPRLGVVRADKLTAADVHKWLADLERDGIGCRTRQLALLRLGQALKWAAGIDLLRRNVAERIAPPRCTPSEKRALTQAEKRDFLAAAAHDPLWPLWRVYLMTGLRRGEGLGLRWSDLDLNNGFLSVRQQVSLVKGHDDKTRPAVHELKTASARRTLDLDVETARLLRNVYDAQRVSEKPSDILINRKARELVFATRHGTPLNPNNVLRNFARIKADAGLDSSLTIHALRHTHATDCIEAGMDWLAVAARLGHSDPSISHSVYGHHRPGRERGIIDRLAAELAITPPHQIAMPRTDDE